MSELIDRQQAIDGKISIQRANGVEIYSDEAVPVEYLKRLPTIQPEPTDEQAIVHLQSSGWMQRHDKEMYESGLNEQLADDSDSYDSLLPTVQPELDSETLIRTIETGITATNSNDAYSLGMRNGMRWCKSLIDGAEPKFEDDVMSVDDGKELPSVQPEPTCEQVAEYCKRRCLHVVTDDFFRTIQPEERTEKRTETHACDLICRKDALDAVSALCDDCDSDHCGSCRVNYPGEKDAIKALKDLPPVQPGPHWIPLEEKMPDTNIDILLQFKSNMTVGFYEDGDWAINTGDGIYSMIGDNEEKPIAWMPLPLVYTGDEK